MISVMMAPRAFSQATPFIVTIEPPGLQFQVSPLVLNGQVYGATGVIQQTFNSLTPGFQSTGFTFDASNPSLGSYDRGQIQRADPFGGAGGVGNYLTVNTRIQPASSPTTLTFSAPQRYFGMWWSAGDPGNVLQFYSGNTLIQTFVTKDVINFITTLNPTLKSQYFGNPNPNFQGQNRGEPYVFLNFFADPSNGSVTFDKVVFSNVTAGGGFESDNHTIAATYTDITGMDIDPATPVDLGGNPNSTDTLGVEGPGSTLTDSGTAVIGDSGTGTLDVIVGGTVTDGGTVIGQNPGSAGTVNVTGPGSSLQDSGSMIVGEGGSGILDITSGGHVTDTNATVGAQLGSSGTVIVDGAGSQWDNSGSLDIGTAGSGVVDVAHGGVIVALGGTTVDPKGTLMGDGTITTPILINTGVVIVAGPGGTPGTLTLNGNYQQGSTGVLDTEIGGPQPSQADQLKVNGSAKLDGTLDITSLNNFHPSSGNSYVLLSATGGLSGEFSMISDTANNTGLSRLNIYGPNGVMVTYLPPGFGVLTLRTSTPLPSSLSPGSLNAFLIPLLDPTAEQLSSLYQIWFSNANTQRFNIENRFDDLAAGSTGFVSNVSYPAPPPTGKEVMEGKVEGGGKQIQAPAPSPLRPGPENRWGVWVTGYGDFVNVDDAGSVKGYDFTTGGVSLGIDYRLTQHFVVGLMGGYSHSWTGLVPTGSIDVDEGWGGVYSGYFDHGFYANGAVYGGHYTFQSERAALLGMANGSSGGGEWSTYVASGYDFHLGRLRIGPLAALQYTVASLDGFTERGSVAPLKVSSDSQDSLVTDVGFRAAANLPVGSVFVDPFVRVAWEHECNYSSLPISSSLAAIPSSPTNISGPSLGHNSAVINAGLSVQWNPHLSTYINYDGQLGRNRYNSNGVSGGFRYAF